MPDSQKVEKTSVPVAVARMMAEAEAQAAAYNGKALKPIKNYGESIVESADDARMAFKPLTDLGNAERFVARNGKRFCWVPEIGWLHYDGKRWSRNGAETHVMLAAHKVARAIQDEARAIKDTDANIVVSEPRRRDSIKLSEKIAAHGRSSESRGRLEAMVKLAIDYLAMDGSQFDAAPWKLNVENGTICIQSEADDGDPITFRPHDAGDYITKLAPVSYDPEARCDRFDHFLAEVQPEPDVQRFLLQWFGYSLTGDTGEQKLLFLYGKGRNGKSTLVDTVGFVTGDYGETVLIETFLDQGRGRNAGSATPDLALLPGVRFLRTSEPEKGSKLAEALIKLVTGGEPIQARNLGKDYFKFKPDFKLTMSGNYRPQISGTDEGIWRRVVLVPWVVTVANPDRRLVEKLQGEASGILNRLLDGLRDYLDNGLLQPPDVMEATRDYREDSDPLGRFLTFAVDEAKGERITSKRLHDFFTAWARASGEREWSAKGLSSALKERGWRAMHSNGTVWLDKRLTKSTLDLDIGDPAPHCREDSE